MNFLCYSSVCRLDWLSRFFALGCKSRVCLFKLTLARLALHSGLMCVCCFIFQLCEDTCLVSSSQYLITLSISFPVCALHSHSHIEIISASERQFNETDTCNLILSPWMMWSQFLVILVSCFLFPCFDVDRTLFGERNITGALQKLDQHSAGVCPPPP